MSPVAQVVGLAPPGPLLSRAASPTPRGRCRHLRGWGVLVRLTQGLRHWAHIGVGRLASPSLRTGRAVFPHPALRSVVCLQEG